MNNELTYLEKILETLFDKFCLERIFEVPCRIFYSPQKVYMHSNCTFSLRKVAKKAYFEQSRRPQELTRLLTMFERNEKYIRNLLEHILRYSELLLGPSRIT